MARVMVLGHPRSEVEGFFLISGSLCCGTVDPSVVSVWDPVSHGGGVSCNPEGLCD